MHRLFVCLFLAGVLGCCFAGTAPANDYLVGDMSSTAPVVHYRTVAPFAAAPVTHYHSGACYRPIVTYPQPVVAYRPLVNMAYAPVATAYSPVVQQPVHVVTRQPVVAYRPAVAPHYVAGYAPVAGTPVVVGQPYLTRTKYFVPGQPIQNVFRAVLPGVPTGVVIAP
jgi:hypothetical protein